MEREILEVLGLFVIGAPLLSLSVRLALRPMLGAIRELHAAFEALAAQNPPATARLAQLEAEMDELRSQLASANEALVFERELRIARQEEPSVLPRV